MKKITLKTSYLRLLSQSKMIETIADIKVVLIQAMKILSLNRVILYQKISKKEVKVITIVSSLKKDYKEDDIVLIDSNLNLKEVIKTKKKISSIPVEGVGEDFAIKILKNYYLTVDDVSIARNVFKVEKELLYNLALSIKTSFKVRDLVLSNAYDALTSCLNRGSLDHYLDYRTSPFNKKMKLAKSICFIDIDHFGLFNKKYGHSMGDQVLKEVALVLKEGVSDIGAAYRYGGEEFVIISYSNEIKYAENLRIKVKSITNTPERITISLGVAIFRENLIKTLKRSNQGLLQAKETGRDKVIIED